MMFKYFQNVKTTEQLKQVFKAYCLRLHPDKGGDAAAFAAMMAEYELAAQFVARAEQAQQQERQQAADDNGSEPPKAKTAEEILAEQKAFAAVLRQLITLPGLTFEVCGSWLWVGGETYQHRIAIKAAGCKYASKKKLWYWHYGEWQRKTKKEYSMQEIRALHGSEKLKPQQFTQLAARA